MEGTSFETLQRLAEGALAGAFPSKTVKETIRAKRSSAGEIDRAVALVTRRIPLAHRLDRCLMALVLVAERMLPQTKSRQIESLGVGGKEKRNQ